MIRYEISNFAKSGFISKHNSSYWKGQKYIGIGPSAHSFDGKSRQWNIANNGQYVKAINSNSEYFEHETLTKEQQYNEYILTALRTKWGVDKNYVSSVFGQKMAGFFEKAAKKQEGHEYLKEKESIYTLSEKGKFLADRISSDLFWGE